MQEKNEGKWITDHVLLRLFDFADDPPIFITVRTRTKEGAVSSDSNVCRVPRDITNTTELTNRTTTLGMQSNPLNLVQTMPTTGGRSSMISSLVPMNVSCGQTTVIATTTTPPPPPTLTTTATTTDLLQTSQGTAAATAVNNLMNNSMIISRPTVATSFGGHHITPGQFSKIANKQPQWKTPNQYYIFHPHALRRDLTTTEEKPSVLEMEHNYLLKHRVPPWTLTSQNSRTRFEHYLRSRTDDRSGRSLGNFPTRTGNFLPLPVVRVRTDELCSTRSEPDLRPMALDDFSCRWFVALFDYSHHMSPNANAQQEELSFRKHQLIKVFGDVDQDGFYTGQIGHRIGLVPSNMVIEIAKDDLMPPQRRRSDAATSLEPSLRRMRWGSLKSRSYDHAGDRRPPRSRMMTTGDNDQYPSIDRRDHSLPNRSGDYFGTSLRRMPAGDYRMLSARSEYGNRGGTGAAGDEYDIYPPNGRHGRDYYGYTRDHRPRETTAERREYYVDERDLSERERAEFYESEGPRDLRERDMRSYRDIRESRDTRDYRDFRDSKYSREPSMTRRERDYLEEHDDQRMRDYRDSRDYREQRDVDYRDMRKDRESDQSGRDGRSYERRTDYGRHEKGHGPMREYAISSGAAQSYYPSDTIGVVEDSRHGRMNGGMPVRKFVAKFDYDSRELSPNVDAEQVELSFHAGDVITVYGEMDEDGFFMGELNGIRGLVPSNFLHTSSPNLLVPTQMPPQQQQQASQVVPPITIPIPEQQTKPKGVVFQENTKKSLPGRQSSQISSTGKQPVSQTSMKSKSGAATGTQKAASKKPSETGSKSTPNARKTSQTGGKKEGAAKV
uniref:SH3 domain-containing protein n=1 Tax=Elaeophora elaphi TaxID=1147741 RepID=A0A0R3S5A3_9BILA